MKRISIIIAVFAVLIGAGFYGEAQDERRASPSFYLGTDRSFGTDERPYVNLEGPGNRDYSFRVYKVTNPDSFFLKSVKGRLVKQGSDEGYANAVALFRETFDIFKKDFRQIARKEFNAKTRSQARKATGVDLEEPIEHPQRALPAYLAGQQLLFTFSIPKSKSEWSYRRVPIPLKDNGVYLIEGVANKSVGYTVIVKSNLTFVTKQSDAETLMYVARRDTGVPAEGSEVKIYRPDADKPIAAGVAEKGIFSFKGKTPAKSLIVVKRQGEYAVSDPDFYAKSFYGTGGVRAYIYTDRPVYRPGDQVFFKGILRSFEKDDYTVSTGAGSVKVVTEKGDKVTDGIQASVSPDSGTFEGTFTLPNDATPYLGNYNLILSYNGKDYSTEFAVDAYRKPPFLVKVATPKRSYIGKEKISVTVSAKFYYGAPVAGEAIHYRVFRKKKYDFSPVGALPFFAEASEYLGMTSTAINELVTDGKGKTSSQGNFEFSFSPDKTDTDYTYSIIADVSTADATISGAAAVSVNRSAFFIRAVKDMTVFSPGDSMTLDAKLIPFDVTLTDADRKTLIGKRPVHAVLYTRSFVNISQEAARVKVNTLDVMTDADGVARFSFKLPKKGHYIVVLTTKDPSGAETETETPLWVSGKSDSIEVPFKNITLKSSKDLYEVGDEAEVLIMTPSSDGTLFVTLEGSRIIGSEIVKLAGNTSRYRVKITPAMAPNFTVSVTQFAHNEVYKSEIKIVAPPREKFLSVKLSPAKKEYRPGDTAEITIDTLSDKGKGVPAEVSLAVVDEAIYQIREDQNPNIATFFYHPRTNNVSTIFSSAYRFFGYAEERRLKLALDAKKNPALAALKEDDAKSRERFKDTTYWSAKVKTDAQGHAVVKVRLADNITTWRVTAVAVTPDTKVGQGKTQFLSRRSLMVTSGIPPFMIRGDAQTVVANVANLTDKKIDVQVNASAEGGVIEGDAEKKLTLDPGKNAPVYYTVRPSNDPNASSCAVEFRVAGGGLSDGVKQRIPLIVYGRKTALPVSVALKPGNDRGKASFNLPAKMVEASCEVRLLPGSGEALRTSLAYLAGYPYGCIEQTMSRFMPLLAAKQAGYISPKLKNDLPKMVAEGMRLIANHQKNDGGFAWFGDTNSDPMMTAYVYRGLLTSKKLFGNVDPKLISRARYFLYKSVDSGRNSFEKAYILFSLSEGEKIQKSMLDSLVSGSSNAGAYTKALAALTCINMNDARGESLYRDALKDYMKQTDPDKISANDLTWDNDQVETGAALLTAAVRLGNDEQNAEKLAERLVLLRRGIAWKNSRDTAFAVMALSEKLMKYRETAQPSNLEVTVNGKPGRAVRVSAAEVEAGNTTINVPGADIRAGANTISINKTGGGAVYATVLVRFIDKSDSFAPLANGFAVDRRYYNVDASRDSGGVKMSIKESASFKAGDLVMVVVHAKKTDGAGDYIMIEDPLPAGFSVVKNDGEYYSTKQPKEYAERQFYDDRSVFFVKGPTADMTIRYFIRADLPGNYRTLPSTVSLMYYPEKNGSSADARLGVAK